QLIASSSICGRSRAAAILSASVVLPAPEVPTTTIRIGPPLVVLASAGPMRWPASHSGDASAYTRPFDQRDTKMPENMCIRPTASVAPPVPPLLMPQPPIAPLLPPVHVVDLMTAAGSAVFDARWRAKEAKIVECPALTDAMPEFRTTYDIEPHAEERGFDDSDWPVVAATELGAKRGGGMVS